MSAAHTPGPWAPLDRCNAAAARHVRIMSDIGEVAIASWAGSERATDGNAALIATAPRLLELIEQAATPGGIGQHEFTRPGGWLDRARAAIAQAKGGRA